MRKTIIYAVMSIIFWSCSTRQDGIYQQEDGWDYVHEGKTYEYRCEHDGLYLYIDWDGTKEYGLSFRYKDSIYKRTTNNVNDYSYTPLTFLCKNKDGKYVYVANYTDFDGNFNQLESISLKTDQTEVQWKYEDIKGCFRLLETYVKQ